MLLMHWGILLVFAGHIAGFVGGITFEETWTEFFRYAAFGGGLMTIAGSGIALLRRITVPEVKAMSQPDDYIIHIFLIAILGVALYQYAIQDIFGMVYAVSPWFVSIWVFAPDPELMEAASLLTKIHVFLAITLAGYFPFTKLAHVLTVPINYFVRPYQSMRTVGNKFKGKWEYSLRSDKSFMVYLLLFFFVGTIILAKYLIGLE
jgi:respiratory nitrate reductase gamma subunit